MEWLNQSTDGWKLKKSFALYLFLSFIIGITFSKVFSLILTELQNQIFNSSIKEIQLNGEFVYYYIKDKSMLAEVLQSDFIYYLNWFSLPIFSFVFAMLGFLLFYKHKIKSSIDYLQEKNSIEDVPQNELGEACTLIQKRFRELEHTQIRLKIQQDNFEHLLSTFAHDINNPLTVVKGNVELLGMISETDKKMEREVLESLEYNLERIENYTKRLEKLIVFDNLDLNLRSVSVKEIEKIFSKSFISFPIDKSLEWKFTHSSTEIFVDLIYLQEAFDNVLSNAVGHCEKRVFIEFKLDRDYFIINVIDDGRGFSREALSRATQRFYSENPRVGSMGIGLNVTQTIVQKHNGKLLIENTDSGAKVSIKLNR